MAAAAVKAPATPATTDAWGGSLGDQRGAAEAIAAIAGRAGAGGRGGTHLLLYSASNMGPKASIGTSFAGSRTPLNSPCALHRRRLMIELRSLERINLR